MDKRERTVEDAIIYCDDVILGKTHAVYNEGDKRDCMQLRDWLKELKVLRRSQKSLLAMHKRMNPKSEADIINELIEKNLDLELRLKAYENK